MLTPPLVPTLTAWLAPALVTGALLSGGADDHEAAAAPAVEAPRFEVTARLAAETLAPGEETLLVVDIEVDGEIHADFSPRSPMPPGGVRKPVLQLEVPDCIELLDGPAEGRTARASLDHMFGKPYGRLLDAKHTEIPVRLVSEPADGDEIGLNVVNYLGDEHSTEATFVRRRLQLPVEGGAEAKPVPADRSGWGTDESLAIGDPVADFDLPDGRGKRITMKEWLGRKRPVFAFTYRSSW